MINMLIQKHFKSLLNESLNRMSLQVSLSVREYLEKLLVFYLKSDHLFEVDSESGKKTLKPFAEIYLKAQNAPLSERLFFLKQIGDRSLYLGGFFKRALQKKIVSLDYYINIGQGAYDYLAEYHQGETFKELSYSFEDILNTLSYMSSRHSIRSHEDLMNICSEYLRTECKALAIQLEDHGFHISSNHKSSSICSQ